MQLQSCYRLKNVANDKLIPKVLEVASPPKIMPMKNTSL